ncbi:MAG: 50S ribosomal protein L14 [bacterium]
MLQEESVVKCADNTGAKKLKIFRLGRGQKRRFSYLGEIVTMSVKEASPHGMVKKGDVVEGVIVRTRKEVRRKDGSYIRFDDNAVVLVDTSKKEVEIRGTRIFGPVARELRTLGFQKIISLAPEVL